MNRRRPRPAPGHGAAVRMTHMRVFGMLVVGALAAASLTSVQAQEAAETMQSAAERVLETAPGAWQGHWQVLREDPRIRSLGAARALNLQVIQDAGSPHAEVRWTADRAICDDPLGDPCEWIGAAGVVPQAVVTPLGLYAVLPISADIEDPFVLHLSGPAQALRGSLFTARGDLSYAVSAQREDHAP